MAIDGRSAITSRLNSDKTATSRKSIFLAALFVSISSDKLTRSAPRRSNVSAMARVDEAGERIMGLLESRLLPKSNGAPVPEPASLGMVDSSGGAAAQVDLLQPKASLFQRKKS